MKYLLDTNALIGLLFRPDFLSSASRAVIEESDELYVSIISLWEIGIKQSIGKLEIDSNTYDIERSCTELNISQLPLTALHIDRMKSLPLHHRDPFDRILIAQACVENMIMITSDSNISKYEEIKTLW